MKNRELIKIAAKEITPLLCALGFEAEKSGYRRVLPNGIVHSIGISMDVRSNETFYVTAGVNALQVDPRACEENHNGCVRLYDLTPDGFGSGSGHWPCETREAAIVSFRKIAALMESLVEPWFQSIVTLSRAAEFFNTEGRIGTPKLFYEDGNLEQALFALDEREKWLSRPMPWETKEWKADQLAEVLKLREKWKAELERRSK